MGYSLINEYFFTDYTSDTEIDVSFLESAFGELFYEFCDKHLRYIPWNTLSISDNMTETFLERYWSRFDWRVISSQQKLSSTFILRHLSDLDAFCVTSNENVSTETKAEVLSYLIASTKSSASTSNVPWIVYSWIYQLLEKLKK